MTKTIEYRDKIINVIQSAITVAAVVSQVAAEVVKALGSWDGQWINLVAVVPAVVFAIRRVTPVTKADRGLS